MKVKLFLLCGIASLIFWTLAVCGLFMIFNLGIYEKQKRNEKEIMVAENIYLKQTITGFFKALEGHARRIKIIELRHIDNSTTGLPSGFTLIDDLGILDRKETKNMEDQTVKIERYRLEALASCIESAVHLWQENLDFSPSQHPSEILLHAAKNVKGWIQNNCGNGSKSKE